MDTPLPVLPSDCCAPAVQATCCAATEKAECCGSDAGTGGCGCTPPARPALDQPVRVAIESAAP
jgi:hypothetical protein